jgi:hypothetical protein
MDRDALGDAVGGDQGSDHPLEGRFGLPPGHPLVLANPLQDFLGDETDLVQRAGNIHFQKGFERLEVPSQVLNLVLELLDATSEQAHFLLPPKALVASRTADYSTAQSPSGQGKR